jgi:hypothetical protein
MLAKDGKIIAALTSRLAEIHQFPNGAIFETLHPRIPL